MRVLRMWPIEAGVHPDFQVDADGRAARKQGCGERALFEPARLRVDLVGGQAQRTALDQEFRFEGDVVRVQLEGDAGQDGHRDGPVARCVIVLTDAEQPVHQSGGKGPSNAALFDTEGRTTPIRTPRWPLPLYAALALLLLDVLLRRVRLYGAVIDRV